MNGYFAFYKRKTVEVYAESAYGAQLKAAKILGAKKSHEVTVMIAEKDGEQIVHKPLF